MVSSAQGFHRLESHCALAQCCSGWFPFVDFRLSRNYQIGKDTEAAMSLAKMTAGSISGDLEPSDGNDWGMWKRMMRIGVFMP